MLDLVSAIEINRNIENIIKIIGVNLDKDSEDLIDDRDLHKVIIAVTDLKTQNDKYFSKIQDEFLRRYVKKMEL